MSSKKLLARMLSEQAPRSITGPKPWYVTLDDQARTQLEEVRDAYMAGKLAGWNLSALHRRVKSELNLNVGYLAFCRFIKGV